MQEKEGNIIEYSMSTASHIFVFQLPRFTTIVISACCFVCPIVVLFHNTSMLDKFYSFLIFLGIWLFVMFIVFMGYKLRKKQRIPLKLRIDKCKKEFWAKICFTGEEVCFKAEDIKEAVKNAELLVFFIKDGSRVTWPIDPKTQESLESVLASMGISVSVQIDRRLGNYWKP